MGGTSGVVAGAIKLVGGLCWAGLREYEGIFATVLGVLGRITSVCAWGLYV